MSDENIPTLLIGATGYIGGSVLTHLLRHPQAKNLKITALVRSPSRADLVEKVGVKTVIGSTADLKQLESLAEGSHLVISCADADDLDAIKAILSGMKKRFEKTKKPGILIHTSGTGVLTSDDRGEFATDTIYDDKNVEQIESLPITQVHRDVDLTIVEADQQGYIRSYIILPSTIYGIASGPLVDLGAMNPHSQQIPALIKAALGRGQAGHIGRGAAMWPSVHIDDVSELYVVIFEKALNEPDKIGHGREGFYFGENGEHTWYDISKQVGIVTKELGLVQSEESTPFAEEELEKYFRTKGIGYFFGSNSRCRANRSREAGWKPKYTTVDMLASIKPEVEVIVKQREA